jgi:hypothetical protein
MFVIGGVTNSNGGQEIRIDAGGDIDHNVYGNGNRNDNGKEPYDKDPNDNRVTVGNGTTVTGNVVGARVDGDNVTVSRNIVRIVNGSVNYVVGGLVSTGTVEGNEVIFSEGTADSIRGGECADGTVKGNKVTVSGGQVNNNINGGYVNTTGTAEGNEVTMTGGIAGGSIFGGYSMEGNAKGNRVRLVGGTIVGNVYSGGSSFDDGDALAVNNTVNIEGPVNFIIDVIDQGIIYGGKNFRDVGDNFSGNELNVGHEVIVGGIQNFERINFKMSEEEVRRGTAYLTATNGDGSGNVLDLGKGSNREVKIGLEIIPTNVRELGRLKGENKVLLAVGGRIENAPRESEVKGSKGYTYLFRPEIEIGVEENNKLVARVKEVKLEANPEIGVMLKGLVGGVILLRRGNDLLGQEIRKLVEEEKRDRKVRVIVGVEGGKEKYKKGENSVSGISGVVGVVKEVEICGRWILGAVCVEGGKGYSEVRDRIEESTIVGKMREEVEGRGECRYGGMCVVGRTNIWKEIGCKVVIRGGGVSTEYRGKIEKKEGNEVLGGEKKPMYEVGSMYCGVDVGVSKNYKIRNKLGLSMGCDWMFIHNGGNEVEISGKEKIEYDGVNSQVVRGRVEARYEWKESIKPYIGIGVEHEKMSEVKWSAYDILKGKGGEVEGMAVTGEIGVEGKVRKDIRLEVRVRGKRGVREGVSGILNVVCAI